MNAKRENNKTGKIIDYLYLHTFIKEDINNVI